jgi:glycosidase
VGFRDDAASHPRPSDLAEVVLPRRQRYHPSPLSWRDEVLYFLLVDRFSDGAEGTRPLLDRTDLGAARPSGANGQAWRWDEWARSGAQRYQGGTLSGVRSKLDYLNELGVTTLWLSPVLRQRRALDTYHGYGAADFLDVDPRFGTRQDLVALVDAAHAAGLRVVLDIIFNHTGHNWNYPGNVERLTYRHWPGHYDFGNWLGADDEPITTISTGEQGVWPRELQGPDRYTRAGTGDLGAGDVADPHAEHKRTDFENLRDIATDDPGTLGLMAGIYQYWIALTDCDGFRIDTLKHVGLEEARNFCGAVTEYALGLGKHNFFLVGEVAGGEFLQDFYLDGLARNLSAVLDIGEARTTLDGVGKGLRDPQDYFRGFDALDPGMGSHRNVGDRHVSVLNDHDHVSGIKLRFTPDTSFDHQVVLPVAIQLFTLGVPCLYYGTEQAFAPPESSEQQWLPGFGSSDRYLREAMFGPRHPRRASAAGLPGATVDENLPGFGPFGTAGQHCFDPNHPSYRRIAALVAVRKQLPVLRFGRQYPRPIELFGQLTSPPVGDVLAWSRILDTDEALIVANTHGTRGSVTRRVLVDAQLNPAGATLTVVANTAQAGGPGGSTGSPPVGTRVPVEKDGSGNTFVTVPPLGPSEVLVLVNRSDPDEGAILAP